MQPDILHALLGSAVCAQAIGRREAGFRALLEAGSVEVFILGLLYIEIVSAGYQATREFPIGARSAADIALHGESTVMVEAKQMHLKDGADVACKNLKNDLLRHKQIPSLGVLFLVDERASLSTSSYQRFRGRNRQARTSPEEIAAQLPQYFSSAFPPNPRLAVLRKIEGAGRLSIYGWVVSAEHD